MKVSYPLSLKISLWLLLNLLLLAAGAVGFLVARGGLGWSALLAGPSGEHVQNTFNVIAGEVVAAAKENREAVLKRFGTAYAAEFRLLRGDEILFSGDSTIPAEVRSRVESGRIRPVPAGPGPEFNGPFGEGRPFGPGEDRGGRGGPRRSGGPEGGRRPPPPDLGGKEAGPDIVRRELPLPGPEAERGRFLVHTTAPAGYWIGMRVPFVSSERGRPNPMLMLARVDSLWSLLRFLNLQNWLLAATAVCGLSIVFWWPLLRGITKSLSQLTTATEQIADGRFDTRVPAERRDEIGKLGESVNRMAARLDAHMVGQKRFLGDVAHELCSPLARLQMATGILADTAPEHLRETVSDVREEVQQMSVLVNELLQFTKAGLQPREIVLTDLELASLVQTAIARESAEGRVTVNVAAGLRVRGDADLLVRAIGNLVRNAVRYAGADSAITAQATREADRVVVAIEDDGPGVPPEALDRLGEPFFRPEAARTRELGGVGLGLSIVRSSVTSCGGEVRFSNRTLRGFRAELRLLPA